MNPELLERVLSCDRLPSLPAVAVKVIELSQDQQVRLQEIASTISNDQGLSAKILKTVNSSFYGLRTPCASINQAIVMLGLSAVKTLALGFSLVASVAESKDKGFDYETYWQRSLFSGVAAKCIASASGKGQAEEAFLGGLLQDVGMIALHRTLGRRYSEVLEQAGGDHRAVVKAELSELEVAHPDVGAMLCARWKLPAELVMPVKFHERPSAAPGDTLHICQCVGLGNIAADALTSKEPAVALKRFYTRAQEWFALSNAQADAIMKSVTQGTREIAHLLKLNVGDIPDVGQLTAKADQQLLQIALPLGGGPASPAETDAVTGLPTRVELNRNVIAGCERAMVGAGPLSLMLLGPDRLGELRLAEGDATADAMLLSLAVALKQHVATAHGLLCRFDDETFAAFIPAGDRSSATRLAETIRTAIAAAPITCKPSGLLPVELPVTLSIGMATFDPAATGPARITTAEQLVDVTQRALAAAKRAGGASLRVYAPRAAA